MIELKHFKLSVVVSLPLSRGTLLLLFFLAKIKSDLDDDIFIIAEIIQC